MGDAGDQTGHHKDHRERTSQVLRGVLDVCLLSVIAAQPTYGYEMTRRLGERGLGVVGEGSIYPVLGRLQRAGLVETFRVKSENGGPPRKYYRVTEQGLPVLAAWQQSWASTRDAIDTVLSSAATDGLPPATGPGQSPDATAAPSRPTESPPSGTPLAPPPPQGPPSPPSPTGVPADSDPPVPTDHEDHE